MGRIAVTIKFETDITQAYLDVTTWDEAVKAFVEELESDIDYSCRIDIETLKRDPDLEDEDEDKDEEN